MHRVLSPTRSESTYSGPWHTNTVVAYAKKAAYLQDMITGCVTKILVIYCGGTIGMVKDPIRGYYPVPNQFSEFLMRSPTFNDPTVTGDEVISAEIESLPANIGPVHVMPPSFYGKRIAFQILEYDPLKDSCNMTMNDWVKIAADIETYYLMYDAFIILHGTDTMAFTASALSFLLENLGKTVILTGSQIPFSEIRNDAESNFLGALTIAGHFVIPEVTLFFGNNLFRGNRVSKVNNLDFSAFDSPNLKPLASLGVQIDIKWEEILRPTEVSSFRAHKNLEANVGSIRLFPGITETTIQTALSKPARGLILESFGTGNAPDNRPEIIAAIGEAIKRGVVVVNITQCLRGCVTEIYSTGHALFSVGVVSGRDMTAECALAKLSYLLSFPDLDHKTICHLMSKPLRGELTQPLVVKDDKANTSWLGSIFNSTMLSCAPGYRENVDQLLRPLLLHAAAAEGDIDSMRELSKRHHYIDSIDFEKKTALHVAITHGHLISVEWLLRNGANVHLKDSQNRNALVIALQSCWDDWGADRRAIIELIHRTGGRLQGHSKVVENLFFSAIRSGNCEMLKIMQSVGLDMWILDSGKRNALHLAALHKQVPVIQMYQRNSFFAEKLHEDDVLGMTPIDIATKIHPDLLPFFELE